MHGFFMIKKRLARKDRGKTRQITAHVSCDAKADDRTAAWALKINENRRYEYLLK